MKNRGFTLIELLVVIAIIGILSGIVITALGGAREKARFAKVKQEMSQIRSAAELYALSNNNKYSTANISCGKATACAADSVFGTNSPTYPYIQSIGGLVNGWSAATNSTNNTWGLAVYYPGISQDTGYTAGSWCVDSTGYTGPYKGTGSGLSAGVCNK